MIYVSSRLSLVNEPAVGNALDLMDFVQSLRSFMHGSSSFFCTKFIYINIQ